MTSTNPDRARTWVDRFGLVVILIGFITAGVWYSLAIPPFETPDELYHYAFARHLAQGNPLPVQGDEPTGPWQQEGSQAPLYYWLVGRLTAGIDQSDFDQIAVTNPRSNMGDPLYPGNKNRMLYSARDLPMQGTNLALHSARWFSLFLGVLTLLCVAWTARSAFPAGSRLALLPPLLLAAIPQFVFISASCSNDNMIIAASAAVLAWLTHLLVQARTRPIHLLEWSVLGILLGVAALSKLQGLGLFVLAAGVGLWIARQRRDALLPLRALLPVVLPALLIAGWWYWRNYTLYGDWFGLNHLVSINGLRTEPLEWGEWWLEFRGLRYSFWGLFGWFNILLPQWIYWVLDATSLLALAGLLLAPFTGHRSPQPTRGVRMMLAFWALLSFALVVYWVNRATGSQGRLFFPAIGAVVILLVIGLHFWLMRLPRRAQQAGWAALVGLLVGASVYTGAVLFPRSYAPLSPIEEIPASAQPVAVTYGDRDPAAEQIQLLAVDLPDARYAAGDRVPVKLYLTAPTRLRHDYEVFIQLLDETGAVVGNVTTHPGWGRFPTTLWQPGAIYGDAYEVLVHRRIDPHAPLLARIYTGFIAPEETNEDLSPISAYNGEGAEIMPVVGTVVLTPWSAPSAADLYTATGADPGEAAPQPDAQFDTAIKLIGAHHPPTIQAGETLTVTLLWEATSNLETDYTAFVHILDADNNWVAGFDQAPGGARFPTHAWTQGDRVLSTIPVALPAGLTTGDYRVWMGLYESASAGQSRVSVNSTSQPVAHNMVQLGSLDISP